MDKQDYRQVLGQVLHHLGVEIELGSIDIHNSDKTQGLALNYIGQILKGSADEDKLRDKISQILDLDLNKTHILEISQELLCHDWKERITLLKNR